MKETSLSNVLSWHQYDPQTALLSLMLGFFSLITDHMHYYTDENKDFGGATENLDKMITSSI